jgi:hypothetical protein
MSGLQSQMDEDQDLRQLLQTHLPSTSADHDAAVLQAARNFARSEASPALEPSTPRSARPTRRWLGASWAVAAGVVAIVVTAAVWREQALRHQLEVLTKQSGAISASRVVMLLSPVLSPGVTRGPDSLAEVVVPPGVSVVHLRLELATTVTQRGYEVDLTTRAGRAVWHGKAPTVQARGQGILTAEIPATVLVPGEYELSLRDASKSPPGQVDYYYFKARRE